MRQISRQGSNRHRLPVHRAPNKTDLCVQTAPEKKASSVKSQTITYVGDQSSPRFEEQKHLQVHPLLFRRGQRLHADGVLRTGIVLRYVRSSQGIARA